MFDLESTAHRLTNRLLHDSPLEPVQKGKVEYGLALVLGVVTELVLTVGVSLVFGTALYTLIIMLSALSLRLFTGGAHCSSFRRCVVFTMVYFIGVSLLVKTSIANLDYQVLMWVSLILALLVLPLIWKPKRPTFLVWVIGVSLPIYGLLKGAGAGWSVLILSMAAGLLLQAFMSSSVGRKVVWQSDKAMQRLRI